MTLTLIFFILFVTILSTLVLWASSSARFRTSTSKMGILPTILGIVLAGLTCILIKKIPGNNDITRQDIIHIGLTYGLVLAAQLIFFMKLNRCHKDYSLASFIGIFGTMCCIICMGLLFLIEKGTITFSKDDASMILFGGGYHTFIIAAAIGVFCGSIYNRNKTLRNIGLLLAGMYVLCNCNVSYFVTLFMKPASEHEFFNTFFKLTFIGPVAGWAIFLLAFNLDSIDNDSSDEIDITNIDNNL